MLDHRSRFSPRLPAPGWVAVSRALFVAAVLLLAPLWTGPLAAEHEPVLEVDDGGASAGHLRLEWHWVGDGEEPVYDIEMDRRESFGNPRRIHRGPDSATVLSGLSNGTYFFRARVWLRGEPVTAWSEPVRAEIEHHSLARALGLFALGGVVFAATVALIFLGHRQTGGAA
ncbi:MAG: hypothetical protein ACQERR_07625 [Pseudomonadota bacterium]